MNYPSNLNNTKNWCIIANGAECSTTLLNQRCHGKIILVLDSAILRFEETNLFVNYVLGDFDLGMAWVDDAKRRFPNIPFIHKPDQNATDLEKGILFALENGASHIDVLWATGRRMDHVLSNFSILRNYPPLLITFHDDQGNCFRLPKQFEKEYSKNVILSLMALGLVRNVLTKNLKYPLYNEDLEIGIRNGNSNSVSEDGMVSITHESGCLLLMECWE